MKYAKGFTLLEILIATTLATLIIFLSYQFFNNVSTTSNFLKKYTEIEKTSIPLFSLFLKDLESSNQSYGTLKLTNTDNNSSLSFFTENCYFFPGICKVKYWTLTKNKKLYLIRSEYKLNSTTPTGIDIPLTSKLSSFKAREEGTLLTIYLTFQNNETLPLTFHLH